MSTRQVYIVSGSSLDEVKIDLNRNLQAMADRMDKIEGIRGGSNIESNLDMNDNTINNVNIAATDITATDIESSGTSNLEVVRVANFGLSELWWNDITADLSTGKIAGANVPTWSQFRNGIKAYEFSASSMKEIWIAFHINHNYADGTKVYPHVHWAPHTTSTGVVRWGFEYTVQKGHDQDAFPASTTVYVNHTVASNKQYQHIISEISDADAFDAFEADALILLRIFRDAGDSADTFPDTVFAFETDIHFQLDKVATPNKAPPFF
jgi:hypothetical protein